MTGRFWCRYLATPDDDTDDRHGTRNSPPSATVVASATAIGLPLSTSLTTAIGLPLTTTLTTATATAPTFTPPPTTLTTATATTLATNRTRTSTTTVRHARLVTFLPASPVRTDMAIGDVYPVEGCTDLHYLDTGMYDTPEYGAVYVVDAERPALVDTGIGTNYERVLDAMATVGIAPEDLAVIAPTHVHLDHAGGTGFLAEACPNAEVVCHEVGAPHLADPDRLWAGTKAAVGDQIRFYTEPQPVPEERIREVSDGDRVDLGDHELVVHHAPGHAPHHCVFEDPANDAVFTADAAGIWVQSLSRVEPTTPPPNFDYEQCMDDIDTVADLEPSTLLFAHYGPVAGTESLDEYREVLTEWVEGIAEKRDELGDDEAVAAPDAAVVDHFVERALAREDLVDAWGVEKVRPETEMNVRGVLGYLDGRDSDA